MQPMHAPLLTALCLVLASCSDRAHPEECYPLNPNPAAAQDIPPLVCGHEVGYLPETPEGIDPDRGPYHGIFCDPAPADGDCNRCPTEDVLDYLRGRVLERMQEGGDRCQPATVDHVEPACVMTPDQSMKSTCCYEVWYWGQCNTKG